MSTFAITSDSGRRYAEEDLALVEGLAPRGAAVVEDARLHQELTRSEQRFPVALAHTHVSIFETDRDLRYSWVYNPMYGLRAEDLVGRVTAGVTRLDEAAYFEARKRAVRESGAPSRDEIGLTLGGTTHHCVVHWSRCAARRATSSESPAPPPTSPGRSRFKRRCRSRRSRRTYTR